MGAVILQELPRKAEAGYVPAASVASIYLGLRDWDKTFEWLGRAVEEREGPVLMLNVSPFYDTLRPDPRFAALLGKMRLA